MELVLCHRDRLVADAIRSVLDSADLRIVVATSLEDVLELAPAVDVCLIDVQVPNALDTITQLVAAAPETRVLVLVNDVRHVRAAERSGASGWVTTGDGLDRLVHMLRHGSVSAQMPALKSSASSGAFERPRHGLTTREAEVLAGLIRGESTKTLAAQLNVTPATARTHVQNVLGKLGVHTRLQAVAVVVEQSLLSSPYDLAVGEQGTAIAAGT